MSLVFYLWYITLSLNPYFIVTYSLLTMVYRLLYHSLKGVIKLTNAQVAEDFANGLRHGASDNMFIETSGNSTVVFSYGRHFPIAIKTDNVTYFNSLGYSNTTARHKA